MLSSHLKLGSRLTFVGGKGGVGKTTVAAALALELTGDAAAVLVLSTDPAHSLGDALGVQLGPDPREITEVSGLKALEVDADLERRRFFERHGESIEALIERGTYLDEADTRELTDSVLPGMDELAALFAVMRYARQFDGRLVVDTAPTGHTLRLLELPTLALGWLEALEAMEAKHSAVASALVGSYSGDVASDFLFDLRTDLESLTALLEDPVSTRFVLVTNPEPVVLGETRRYREQIERLGIAPGGIIVNRQAARPAADALGGGMVYVPLLSDDLSGVAGLRRFAEAARSEPAAASTQPVEEEDQTLAVSSSYLPPLDRKLYMVGGKGGVGKTTSAAALAVHLGEETVGSVLLLSVDPAGSLTEVFGIEVGESAVQVPGTKGVWAQQLDAEAAWSEFRRRYEEEVERFFSEMLPGGGSATLDRDVIERLVNLAPPGLDELMALMEVIDLTEDRLYDALVIDTAPTGHFLRFLEMPEVALGWAHSLLRLLLKYREAVSLGGLGERVLKLSKNLRALNTDLRDQSNTFFLGVALPESLSIPETRRLLERLHTLGIEPGALLVNRTLTAANELRPEVGWALDRLIEIDRSVPVAAAPHWESGPASVAELRKFIGGWREVRSL